MSDMKIFQIIQKPIRKSIFWLLLDKYPYNWLPSPLWQWADWWTLEKWKWPKIMKTWHFHLVKSVFDLKQAEIRIKTDFGSHLPPLKVRIFHQNMQILCFLACDTPSRMCKGWIELELNFCYFLFHWCWIYSKKYFLHCFDRKTMKNLIEKRKNHDFPPIFFAKK